MVDQEQLDALLSSLIAAGRPSSMSLPRPQGLANFTELAQWLAGPSPAPAGEDRTIPGPAGPVHRYKRDVLLARQFSLLPVEGASVLEFGCGPGYNLRVLSQRNPAR